jgi:hypothetical protein
MSSETTTKTELPPKTESEKKLDAQIADVLLPTYMEDLGYDIKETTKTSYDNPDKVAGLETRKDLLEKDIAEFEASGKLDDAGELRRMRQEMRAIEDDLSKEYENATTDIGYDYELNERGQKLEAEKAAQLDRESQASEMFFDTYKKFASGDYSITPEQEQLIQESMGNIRGPVMEMLNEIEKQYEATGKSMGQALDEYSDEISKTGLSVEAALSTVEDRINNTKDGVTAGLDAEEVRLGETGQSVFAALQGVRKEIDATGQETRDVLEDTFKMKSVMIDNKMRDAYDQQRKETANRAATLGRSPMDPRFQLEMMEDLNKKIGDAQLQLSIEESSALAGLTERTGQRREALASQEAAFTEAQGRRGEEQGRARTMAEESAGLRQEQVAGERAALAERTGQRQEGVEAQRVGVAERTGAGREAVAGQRAAVEEGTQQFGADLRQQYGVGIPASQIGLGMDVAGYGQAIRQQGLANTAGAVGVVGGEASKMQAERMAQPTHTTTQSGSTFGAITGALGGLASGAGGILTGMGGLTGTKPKTTP